MKLSCLIAILGAASGLLQRVATPVLIRRAAWPRMVAAVDAWLELPMEPDPELDPIDSIRVVCTGLEFNDYPTIDAGVTRLYNWMTPQGRVALAPPPPRSGTQTGVTLDYFLEHAGGAALGSLLSCSHWDCIGKPRMMPATNAHGALATQMIEVGGICFLSRCSADQRPAPLICSKALLKIYQLPTHLTLATQMIEGGDTIPQPQPAAAHA
jgi:hypothetical protein